MSIGDDGEDIPKLSADTLALLGDFYAEREQNEKRFEDLKSQTEDDRLATPLSMTMFTEDWNASQFWVNASIYMKFTILTLSVQ
ncbi:MAG: hypothetical protein Q9221_001169 [Calogaya cf. arnoldii]